MKSLIVKCISILPRGVSGVLYQILWELRKIGYRLQVIHPARLLRLISGSSKKFGPPVGLSFPVGYKIWKYNTEMNENIKVFSGSFADFLVSKSSGYIYKDIRIIDVELARIWRPQGAVIDGNDRLVSDLSYEIGRAMGGKTGVSHSIFTQLSLGSNKKIQGHYGLLCAPSSDTYFHWLFDVLPRLFFLRDEAVDGYIVGEVKHQFQKDSIEMLKLEKPIVFIEDKGVELDKVTGVTHLNRDGFIPEVITFLREHLGSQKEVKKKRRLFISRQKAAYRKLVYYDAIKLLLEQWDIEEFIAEDHSFEEQIHAFKEAELVLAPHGSGLSNIVFCETGAHVIELFSEEYTNALFLRLATNCGLSYDCVVDGDHFDRFTSRENIIIDIKVTFEQVEAALNRWKKQIGL